MSRPRSLPSGQGWFIDAAKVIVGKEFIDRYDGREGMCNGYTTFGGFALINQSRASFIERLYWIHYGPPKPTLEEKTHLISQKKIEELTAIAKEYLKESKENIFKGKEEIAIDWIFSGTPTGYPVVITPIQLNSLIQIAQGIAANYARRFQDEAIPIEDYIQFEWENERPRKLIDIKIFLEGLALGQTPHHEKFSDIYEEKSKPEGQLEGIKIVTPLLAPVELDIEKNIKPQDS